MLRKEMQARLSVDGYRDLYDFWGTKLADQLAAETDFVLNLASKEYSRAVESHLAACRPLFDLYFRGVKGW